MYAARDTQRGPGSEPTDAALQPERVPRAARAYDALKHRLLIGDFPLGQRLRETRLADQLDMSRTPVRDALSRLHAEGLLVRHPDGGFSPVAPDLHTISELYEVRRSLECTALTRGGHDPEALRALLDDWEAMEAPTEAADCSPDFVLHDEDFHVRLAAASGNESLVGMLVSVNERIRMVRMHDFLTVDRVTATIAEHTGIVRTLLDGGPTATGELLSQHLLISEQVVEERAALALSRMIGPRHG